MFEERPPSYRGSSYPKKKQNPRFGNAIPILGMKLKRGCALTLASFQHRPTFSDINGNLSPTPWMIWLNIGLPWKITKIRTTTVLVSHPKQVKASPKTGFCFYCVDAQVIKVRVIEVRVIEVRVIEVQVIEVRVIEVQVIEVWVIMVRVIEFWRY